MVTVIAAAVAGAVAFAAAAGYLLGVTDPARRRALRARRRCRAISNEEVFARFADIALYESFAPERKPEESP